MSPPPRGSRAWWSGQVPVPTLRAAVVLAVLAVLPLALPGIVTAPRVLLVAVLAVLVDRVRTPAPWSVGVERRLPATIVLGADGEVVWTLTNPHPRHLTVALADALPASLGPETRRILVGLPAGGRVTARTRLVPTRRGTRRPDRVTVRTHGPLGLVTRQADRPLPGVVEVHPTFRSRVAAAAGIRRVRLLTQGHRQLPGRGGGTEFEALRDHVEGDDPRHLDWTATARAGRPIVRTFRPERNQLVVVLLDTGRLVAAPVAGVPRLDHLMDVTLALATVTTALDDRIGLVAFGAEVRALVAARRGTGQLPRLSRAMHALDPELAESGYREAFATTLARFPRRALLVVLTELAAEAVQETLLPALPLVTRDHRVVVASVSDPAVTERRDLPDADPGRGYPAAAAATVLEGRERAAARLRQAGAAVLDAPPGELAGRLVDHYLEVKVAGAL